MGGCIVRELSRQDNFAELLIRPIDLCKIPEITIIRRQRVMAAVNDNIRVFDGTVQIRYFSG